MKDFAEFKQSLTGDVMSDVLSKATDYAKRVIEEEYSGDDGLSKAYTFNRLCNEGTIVYLLEKYHEWVNQ